MGEVLEGGLGLGGWRALNDRRMDVRVLGIGMSGEQL